MRCTKKLLSILLCLVLIVSVIPAAAYAGSNDTDLRDFGSVEKIVQNMSLKQKITQCLMMDFRMWNDKKGTPQDMTALKSDVADIIADYQFGSVILFANNIKKTDATVKLTKAMQKAAMRNGGLPMLIATDQEGGIVYRLGSGTALPGNMALGATGDPAYAKTAGEIIGRELSSVGINTTLAPVIDVNNEPNNTVIGLRAFSDDADMVGEYGSAFISGLDEYNIIGCAKHFPGHGDTSTDSHYGIPIVKKNYAKLKKTELKPYKIAIKKGIDMIMTAHILYPKIDSSKIYSEKTGKKESRPATLSKKFLTDILRKDMGFQGVVVTDAMNMKGVADNFTARQSTLEALKAGADIICMPVTGIHNKKELRSELDGIIKYIKKAVKNGDITEARIDEAVTRILTLKEKKGILDYKASKYTVKKALATVGSDENRELEREMAAKAVTLVKNKKSALPTKATSASKVLLLCPYDNERAQMVMGVNRAKEEGKLSEKAKVRIYRYSPTDYKVKDGSKLKRNIDWADLVIINSEVTGPESMSLGNWTSLGPKAVTKYCKSKGKTSVVLSVDKPYDVQLYPSADAVLAVYGCKGSSLDVTEQLLDGNVLEDENACGPNITAGVEVVFGVFEPQGTLPVNIPVFDSKSKTFTDEIRYERGYGLHFNS